MTDAIKWDYGSMGKVLGGIKSVISCRFVVEDEDIKELHIVSDGTRTPKQLSRDIQSILIATYGLNIDYKKISIAELPVQGLAKKENRLKIERVTFEDKGKRASLSVSLSDKSREYVSTQTGVNTIRNIERMLVRAVLDNVEEALGIEDCFILEDVKNISHYPDGIILVVLNYICDDKEKRLCGSSLIEGDYKKAVVKATLDALNRIITK